VVPPISTPLLAGSTAPRAATLELVPSSLDSTPPGAVSTALRRVAAVPPGFLPRAAPATPATPRVAPTTPATPCAVPTSPTAPCAALAPPASHGPPPWVWPASPIAYVCRPHRHAAPTAPTLSTSTATHRPVTDVPVTPSVNPHRMVTHAQAGFRMPREPLVITATTTMVPTSPILTSVYAALTDPNWCVAMEKEYGALLSNGT
jgi:hypothetical protein